ncbi:MAG TPA: ABC transporter permease [Cyclobacteriaceae bacterium]|jgi:ABC-type antimicrobial peptide transport system permease subunit|nr:ABC transporter permease [Cyclobacteriaceae bacterium]
MVRSIFNFVFRNFTRNFSFSIITLSSLVLGITTALLMFLWAKYEVTYNRSVIDSERIYALLMNYETEGEIGTEEGTTMPMMEWLSHDVPEVEAITRISNSRTILAVGEKSIEKTGVYGDSTFFKVHAPERLTGNTNRVLSYIHSIAISQKLAIELFGTDDVLGKAILLDRKVEYQVTGVFSPYPENSHLSYINFVLPYGARSKDADDWVNHDIKLVDASTRGKVEQVIDRKIAKLYPEEKTTSLLFGIEDWRLHWSFKNGRSSGGRIVYVIVFSIASLFVLLMSCVNYMNIATARATKRTREIGVRKMTGATQSILIRQFMAESLIMTSGAVMMSLLLTHLLIPLFNQLVGIQLTFSILDPTVFVGLTSIALLTGLLAGSYPALVLSSFKPALVLKGSLYTNISGAGFRNGLVVFQFALSVVMIFCALVLWRQTAFLLHRHLGYDKYRVINVWLDRSSNLPFDNIISMVESHSSIESAAFGGASPMEINGSSECNRVVAPFKTPMMFYGVNIDERVLTTLKFEFVLGRNFSRDHASDSSNFIVTQSVANLLGFDNPIGKRISYGMYGKQEGEIIGVVKDFQNDDIHLAEKPVVFVFGKPKFLSNLFVKYQAGQLEDALNHVTQIVEKVRPGIALNYSFLDTDFEVQLHRETLMKKISISFTVVAVAIACLGLFGLVLFNAQRRTKEIGIRKVMGATDQQIVMLLCRHVIPFVLYSLLIALPIGYYLMKNFLEEYPARITMSPNLFLAVAGAITFMVLLTISYQSIKAARQNAIDSLKTE